MKIKLTVVALLTVLSFSGCKTSYRNSTIGALHGRWEIVKIYKEAIPEDLERTPVMDINVNEKMITGNSGCNAIRGSFYQKIDQPNSILFSRMAGTQMMCQNIELERRILDAMHKVVSFAKKGHYEIVFLDGEGKPALTIKK